MVEVFKTDVVNCNDAQKLIDQLHENFNGYLANFDLEDCDLILRIECSTSLINAKSIIQFLKERGFHAEVLPDNLEPNFATFQNLRVSEQ
ncbi:hypothetical protein [Pedobacter boryungensis]|uniref:HMA domain-containing protein n=1 Tax=Pedobacter boryungensis TaxID=869962 RepID=A0ABX2D8P6_9SPHI|nr:hypothetical protein [Pedobacter boryungensis]NQX30425.1 hypothetical protein [Pedobacter boryungensis]